MTEIFVFGSNLAGRHGAGAAKYALKNRGAIYGQGKGLQGSSYAIPTKDENLKTLSLDKIQWFVQEFKTFAQVNTNMTFWITAIGCGLAGYTATEIAHMFIGCPENCVLPQEFIDEISIRH